MCTRSVKTDENQRAGRWWWKQRIMKCGLHIDCLFLDDTIVEKKEGKNMMKYGSTIHPARIFSFPDYTPQDLLP